MSFLLSPIRAIAWSLLKGWLHRQFPQVQSISTEKLAAWLMDDLPSPVLIDARQEEEYLVSHLPGAHHLPSVAAIQQAHISPDTALVIYCSVGYRSARHAQQLQEAGYTHVMNLEGSIFEWYNQGRPLVADQQPVQQVHPYNPIWGVLLESHE